jgi:hypothetical protein
MNNKALKELAAAVVTDQTRHVIHAVVEELTVAPPKDCLALQLMPVTNVPFAILEHELLSASGGRTQERVVGEPGNAVGGPSATGKVYKPGAYQEHIRWGEREMLGLRRLGTIGEPGITGLTDGQLNWVDRGAKKLKTRLTNRLCTMAWDALFTGQFVYRGVTFDFGVPGGNTLTAATDWSDTGVGTPFEDLITLVDTNAALIKYRALIKGFAGNPKTLAQAKLRLLESKYITNANIERASLDEIRAFAAPSLPPFIEVADAWQDETYNADGSVTMGAATYMVPDDQLLVVIDFDKAPGNILFPKYGELQITENMNDPSAAPGNPAQGIYTFVDEKGLEERESPYLKIVSGFNGGANLMRPNDLFLINV